MTGSRSTGRLDGIEVVSDLPVPDFGLAGADSVATALLVSRLAASGVQPLKASEYWRLLDRIRTRPATTTERGPDGAATGGTRWSAAVGPGGSAGGGVSGGGVSGSGSAGGGVSGSGSGAAAGDGPSMLIGRTEEELVRDFGLAERQAARIVDLLARATVMAFELDDLEQSGVRTLTAFDEHYPQQWLSRLGAKAPPLLHAAGAIELLGTPGLGVVGSRDVSEAGGEVAREVARLAARRGLPLTSGGARGVDQLAMSAAFEAGGAVVGILAESLSRKLKSPDVRRAVYDGGTVMCTPYSPDAPFSAGNAMGRNKLIYAQAALTVVVASDDGTGGTWSGAAEALKNGYGTVAVWRGDGEGPGNRVLQQRGALPVSSLEDVEALLDSAHDPVGASSWGSMEQQSLFGTLRPG